jgi:hypothetical protein
MGAGAGAQSGAPNAQNVIIPQFYENVRLASWQNNQIQLPQTFTLRLAHESLDFVGPTGEILVQFPYQVIICWGQSPNQFRFSIYSTETTNVSTGSPNKNIEGKGENTQIKLTTAPGVGAVIDREIMKVVLSLMSDMKEKTVMTSGEFNEMRNSLVECENVDNVSTTILKEDWLQSFQQATATRQLIAKQGMEMMVLIGPLAPFERLDLAVREYVGVMVRVKRAITLYCCCIRKP